MRDRDELQRVVKALLAAALTGAGILGLVRYLLLPALARELTTNQVMWLREAFRMHPVWFLLAIFVLCAILGIPVLLVALWTAHRPALSRKRSNVSSQKLI